MKVKLIGPSALSLSDHILFEGDQIVEEKADYILCLEELSKRPTSTDCPIVGGISIFPPSVLEVLSFPHLSDADTSHLFFKWFDKGWSLQTLLGIPLSTLMNDNVGAFAPAGLSTIFIDDPLADELFANTALVSLLTELNYIGFVTISLSSEGVTGVQTWVPFNGFLNVVEGMKGTISEFITGVEPTLLVSWASSLSISRSPYPALPVSDRLVYPKPKVDVLKHFWFWKSQKYRTKIITEASFLGTSTAWASSLLEACRRTIRTLSRLEIEGKQYRTDQYFQARRFLERSSLKLLS